MTAIIKTKEAMERKQITAYELTRTWFDFAFENPDKISPGHAALYLWNVELCNRMGWANKFSSPASQSMAACGISSYNTYKKLLTDLVDWGFIIIIQPSTNQYTANVIALSNFDKALDKALDKAVMNHLTKHSESTVQSTDSINKQQTTNKETLNHKPNSAGEPAGEDSEKIIPLQPESKNENSEKEKEKKLAAKKEKDFSEVQWPFDSPAFMEVWNIWIEYRKQRREKPYVPIGLQSVLKQLARDANGIESEAIEIIRYSMSKNWTGLYPEKNKAKNQTSKVTPYDRDKLRAAIYGNK